MSFEPLNTLFTTTGKHSAVSSQIVIAQALTRAHRILVKRLGDEAAGKLQPAYIQHRTLYIATLEHPLAWLVGQHQQDIIKEINDEAPYPLIQRIQVIS